MKVTTQTGKGWACWNISVAPDSNGNWRDDVVVTKAKGREATISGASTGPIDVGEAESYAQAFLKAAQIARILFLRGVPTEAELKSRVRITRMGDE
jgi:hypothetical protein